MKIKILGWEYENIRRMGNLEINLEDSNGQVYENTLIMMPNGTGKTTTLKLLRVMLSGRAEEWKEKDVRSFRPNFKTVSEGKFCLKVLFDDDLYHYILHLDYEAGEARYETSRVSRTGGIEEGHELPGPLKGIMDQEEFVNRFVFDGEQAQKTLDTGSQEAERAIIYLYQLDKMDELCKEIDKLVEKKQEAGNSKYSERSVQLYQTKAEKKRKKYVELKKQLAKSKNELDLKQKKKSYYEEKYQDIISKDEKMQEEEEKLKEKQKEIRRQIIEATSKIFSFIQKPYNLQAELHLRLQGLWQNMQTLRLPKNVAKEFFNELSESERCICGRCIGELEKLKILENAEGYLGQEEFIVLNEIKSALKEYEIDTEMEQEKPRLRELLLEEQENDNSMDRIAMIMAEQGDNEILKIRDTIKELENDIERLYVDCKQLGSKDIGDKRLNAENNVYLAQKAWQEANDVYTKANGTYMFTKKAEKLKDYITSLKFKALENLKQYIIQETNTKVHNIIKNDNVRIKNIIGHLIFEDRDNLSEGQNLAVAYAYIGTLFEHSQNEFPFVVDSPAAPLDLNMRREIARVMPGLFHQMIVFVTSGEMHGFAETYFERDNVKYFTIEGERDKEVEKHEGKTYFASFQGKDIS